MPEVEVVVQIGAEDVPTGRLWTHRHRNRESATFSYSPDYLLRDDAYELDPMLPLVEGQQQTPAARAIFAAFSDCSPDRWGRRLIQRNEKRRAQREGQAETSFAEADYLLGVRDDLRQGALRFRPAGSLAYAAEVEDGIPHLIELPRLLAAAERIEREDASDEELRMLLRGGSSLGGARPKAHVLGAGGRIAIAKFPSPADDWDVMRWEAVALRLARRAGLSVPDSSLHEIDGKAVLIVDRFDRRGERRIAYMSAMTMIEAVDGDTGSYLEIADAIERHAADAGEELRQLWRRIAFSILISNTDDHLRNHGFLRTTTAGWSLSPAFDLNPNPEPGVKQLSTAIDYDDTSARIDLLMEVAEHYRLDEENARGVLADVGAATSRWQLEAAAAGLGRAAIAQMASAFEHEQAEAVRGIAA